MLKRKIYNQLLQWKQEKKKECLLIKGARQIGKTFIIRQFGKNEYKNYIEINFYEHPEFKKIFSESLDVETILKKISLMVQGVHFIPQKTLIFFDEIQECPQARTALKFLAEDDQYDVIASGSLLGLHFKQITSVPVGYEKIIDMYSLDFEEFLWALGFDQTVVNILKSYFDKLEHIDYQICEKYLAILREYMVVGGMPEVVNTFIQFHNFQKVFEVQQKIISSYFFDIEHYAIPVARQKIRDCFMSIPRQLAKEYTKFQYKVVSSDGSSRKYENCLNWLVDAGLIKMCCNVSIPTFPLIAYEKPEQFKVYMTDIGLLTSLFGFETQKALVEDTLKGPAKGGIYENLIFDILNKKSIPLHYFKNESNSQEIEFIIEKNGFVLPIEVKAKRGDTPSLNNFIKEFNPPIAYKIISGNVGDCNNKITIPGFLTLFI